MTSETSPTRQVSGPRQLAAPHGLRPHDVFWREHCEWLREKGYELRPRYKPGWSPSSSSQTTKTLERDFDEDRAMPGDILDATRISDGRAVVLRKVSRHADTQKLEVHQYLATWPLVSHPKNHSVPILDILRVPGEHKTVRILVMPLLQPFHVPAMQTVGEAVDFLGQVFEGLQFMHSCNIAHRNCSDIGIMQDPEPLYPSVKRRRTSRVKRATRGSESTLRPVRYYLVDFGRSQKYQHGSRFHVASQVSVVSDAAAVGVDDPYATDIRCLGETISETFLETMNGLEFLAPLVADMTKNDPAARPDMDAVVAIFRKLKGRLHWWKLRSRLVRKDEHGLPRIRRGVTHFLRMLGYIVARRPAVPSVT
ncbi:uncharacterized protein PHACADRAFT_258793 [Phanerochaete carnosa HHB-10118-sp]|uniref:Protein kinase domain-containing protein n=1 Tax=Phanerochaete carnosa (strain HHB-10118-sp) TaxID=650164 RepID=K5W713_PHACS|nr:uncharacterized protein PHACADRAFT_258793 [Phanerochaete carnosa HHB-10118-sp]EKM54749.1 hypothetical protein PHACADRAFT_258793 [Phanerochaete carnosa HHB-10118-sp]